MSDHESRGDSGDPTDGVRSGEVYPPEERTHVVGAHGGKKAQKGATILTVHDDSDGPRSAPAEPEIQHRAHGSEVVAAEPRAVPRPEMPSRVPAMTSPRSRDLAARSLKERRRERDRRAERAAFGAVVLFFGVVGVGGYHLLQSGVLDGEAPVAPATAGKKAKTAIPREERRMSATLDETPDLPALRMMARDGLTIAAEGIPEVTSDDPRPAASALAAIETCRFTYGVWEFSPNKRFRFLTTCGPLAGQVLVGAYEVEGSKVRMSPLVAEPAVLVSEFEVEKPSQMVTRVQVGTDKPIVLQVVQRITTMRAGLEGEAFRATYAPKNSFEPVLAGARSE